MLINLLITLLVIVIIVVVVERFIIPLFPDATIQMILRLVLGIIALIAILNQIPGVSHYLR